MIRRSLWHFLPGTPLTALASHGIPWWAATALACLGPTAYICRSVLLYKISKKELDLANKALDKAPAAQAAAVVAAVTSHGTSSPPPSPRRRPPAK
jgi:hypothetical protein